MDEILEKLINSCFKLGKELLGKESLTANETVFLENLNLLVDKL